MAEMKFAVIGNMAEAHYLLKLIGLSQSHDLTGCCATGDLATEIQASQIVCEHFSSIEDALFSSTADVFVIASDDSTESIQMVRRATQEEKPVIAWLPNDVSTAWSYELHMLLDESSVGIVPFTGRWMVDGDLSDNSRAGISKFELSLRLSGDSVLQRRLQLHAIDVMCGTGVRYSQVTGLDIGSDANLTSRTVTLAAAESNQGYVPPAVISFTSQNSSNDKTPLLRLTPETGEQTAYAVAIEGCEVSENSEKAGLKLDLLIQKLQTPTDCQAGMEQLSNTLELLEGLDKSLRRRRTVDVYLDNVSERAVFKTQMTAMGCGVLAYLIFGLIAYLVVAQVFEPPLIVLNIARGVWIAPLVLFILAQFLLPLARDREKVSRNVVENGAVSNKQVTQNDS